MEDFRRNDEGRSGSRVPRLPAAIIAVLVALLLALAAAAAPPAARAQSAPPEVRAAAQHVVTIRGYDEAGAVTAQGSGFLFADGRIATNYHVVRRATNVRIIDADGEILGEAHHAEAVDEALDLAILPAPEAGGDGLWLETFVPEVGERIWAYGSPKGLTGTMTDGIVSAVRERGNRKVIQVSAPISAGSSGGPVLDADGRVIGVIMSSVRGGQNLNFAVPSRELARLGARRGAQVDLPLATAADRVAGTGGDGDDAGTRDAQDDPAQPDLPDRWRYLARNASDAALYYDRETVAKRKDHLRIWIYTVYPEPQTAGRAAFDASKALFEFRCGAGQFRLNQYLLLRDERVIGSNGSIGTGDWAAAAPDSVAEGLLRTVCSRETESQSS